MNTTDDDYASKEWFNDPVLLNMKISNSDSIKAYQRLQSFNILFYIAGENHKELKSFIDACDTPENRYNIFDELKAMQMGREITRLLHNFLASSKSSFVCIDWLVKAHYGESQFAADYFKEERDRFRGNPLAGFIEEFRNFTVHFSYPPIQTEYRNMLDPETNQRTERLAFFVDTKPLQVRRNWDKGKKYLDKAGDLIDIELMVDDYFSQVESFHRWIHHHFEVWHKSDIDWLNKMTARLNELLPEMARRKKS